MPLRTTAMKKAIFAAFVTCGVAWAAGWLVQAEGAGRTTLDGVYSEAQAARGKKAFEEVCAGCHGLELAGAPFVAPTLMGIQFVENWRDDSLATIYQKIKNDMPMG